MLTDIEFQNLKDEVKKLKNPTVKGVLDYLLKNLVSKNKGNTNNPYTSYSPDDVIHKPKNKKTAKISSDKGVIIRTQSDSEKADG